MDNHNNPSEKKTWQMIAEMCGKKPSTKLLEFSLPSKAILYLVNYLNQLHIPYELEKLPKEDLVVIEVESSNSQKIYWVSHLCDLLKKMANDPWGIFYVYEDRINRVIQNIVNAR